MSDCSSLFGIAHAIQHLCIRSTEFLVAEACQMSHLGYSCVSRVMKANDDSHCIAVTTTKFLFGMCDSTVSIDVGTGAFSFVLGSLHVCGHVHVRSHIFPGMD